MCGVLCVHGVLAVCVFGEEGLMSRREFVYSFFSIDMIIIIIAVKCCEIKVIIHQLSGVSYCWALYHQKT